MVQVIKGGPTRSQLISDMLGSSLGEGLGQFTANYMANKAIDKAMNNPEIQKKPLSERWGALEQATRPFGKTGQQLLERRLKVEAQAHQEETEKKSKKSAEQLWKQFHPEEPFPEGMSTNEILQLENIRSRERAANARANRPQGGLTGQPIPPEISQTIGKIISESKGLDADELSRKFDEANIPPIYSNKYVETRRRQDETLAKNKVEENKLTRKEQIDFHKESAKYDEDLLHKSQIAKKQVDTIKDIEKAIESGNVKPSSLANIFKGMGEIGDKISNALLSKDESTLLASIPSLLEGWKDVFGVRLSDADLKVLQDKLPDIGKTPEANKAVLKIMKKYADMTQLRSQIASEIKEKNKGLRPLGYADQIEKRFDEMTQSVKLINPNTGKVITVPAYKAGDAIKAGAKLANE